MFKGVGIMPQELQPALLMLAMAGVLLLLFALLECWHDRARRGARVSMKPRFRRYFLP